MSNFIDPLHPEDLSVVVSDMLVATPDSADPMVDGSVQKALQTLRAMMRVNAVFVAEVTERQKITRALDHDDAAFKLAIGDAVPLEETYCRLVLEGKLPEYIPDVAGLAATLPEDYLPKSVTPPGIKGHVSTPITLADGRVYGTLCCLSDETMPADGEKALMQLRQCARYVAKAIGGAGMAPGGANR